MLAASLVDLGESRWVRRRDRQTAGRTPDRYITLFRCMDPSSVIKDDTTQTYTDIQTTRRWIIIMWLSRSPSSSATVREVVSVSSLCMRGASVYETHHKFVHLFFHLCTSLSTSIRPILFCISRAERF